ncbi:MAG: transcriptional repressor LexA [Desulfomonile tiedjei]|nr:transcriptional repressor LexA [Desulfomonile tiedjei]
MRTATDLTPRQRETLDWVKNFIREHGMPPTVREIGAAFGIKSSSVFDLLSTLERKGWLRRGDLGARSLIVEGLTNTQSEISEVPVVGSIAAGRPIEAIENDRGTIAVSSDLLRGRETYALKVEGESMIDAGILDGDYVIVRQQETADDGDIVVALIGEEATLKRFYREEDGVRLEPANKELTSIHVGIGDFRIQGKVVGVMRMMGNNTNERE